MNQFSVNRGFRSHQSIQHTSIQKNGGFAMYWELFRKWCKMVNENRSLIPEKSHKWIWLMKIGAFFQAFFKSFLFLVHTKEIIKGTFDKLDGVVIRIDCSRQKSLILFGLITVTKTRVGTVEDLVRLKII